MISDPEHPALQEAADQLGMRLTRYFTSANRSVTDGRVFHELGMLIRDHRASCKKQGLDFPQLVALVLPKRNSIGYTIDLIRADIEIKELRRYVIELSRARPGVTAADLAAAVRGAFPHIKSLAIDVAEEVVERHMNVNAGKRNDPI